MPDSLSITEQSSQSSHMDRLTQTQNSIDELVKIMYSTLSYLTRKANFKQVNPDFPITQTIPDCEPADVFESNKRELVSDFLTKAKQLEYLFSVLPTPAPTSASDAELEDLERELGTVNAEYLDALSVAEELHARLEGSLREALDARAMPRP